MSDGKVADTVKQLEDGQSTILSAWNQIWDNIESPEFSLSPKNAPTMVALFGDDLSREHKRLFLVAAPSPSTQTSCTCHRWEGSLCIGPYHHSSGEAPVVEESPRPPEAEPATE
jgi:hypothetical protein